MKRTIIYTVMAAFVMAPIVWAFVALLAGNDRWYTTAQMALIPSVASAMFLAGGTREDLLFTATRIRTDLNGETDA